LKTSATLKGSVKNKAKRGVMSPKDSLNKQEKGEFETELEKFVKF